PIRYILSLPTLRSSYLRLNWPGYQFRTWYLPCHSCRPPTESCYSALHIRERSTPLDTAWGFPERQLLACNREAGRHGRAAARARSEEHTSELQSRENLV